MRRPRLHPCASVPAKAGQRGFTLMEVMAALIIFAISVVGLVAIESRSIEAQKASTYIREAERAAQDTMADLQARGFLDLVYKDFAGADNPSFPYDDAEVDPDERVRDWRRPPSDLSSDDNVPGSVRNQFIVYRSVDWVTDPLNPPSSNPPVQGTDDGLIRALTLEVLVLWIDDTNPAFPPPASAVVAELEPAMVDPGGGDFRPYVGHVRLRTIRLNDSAVSP